MLTEAMQETFDEASPPKIHSGFKNAYVSVNGTLSAVVASATDGKPEVLQGVVEVECFPSPLPRSVPASAKNPVITKLCGRDGCW